MSHAYPKQKIIITHDGADTEQQGIHVTTDVTQRESKGSDATFTAIDAAGTTFLNKISVDDLIQIYFKDETIPWKQVFGGYVVDVSPETTIERGLRMPYKAYGFDVALDRMRAAIEYGVESPHPTLDTVKEILTDASYGLIPKWLQKVLASAIDSGYTLDTSNVFDDPTVLNYLYYPYTPINDCFKTMFDLVGAQKYPNSGLHWLVIPSGKIAKLAVDQVGNHTTAETIWPTVCPIDLVSGANVKQESFTKTKLEANYVIYLGRYEWPTGEPLTENGAALWTYYVGAGATKSDDPDCKVGANSLKFDLGAAGAGEHAWYYPSAKNLALDITKIGTRRSIPSINFYLKASNLLWAKMLLGTGNVAGANVFEKEYTAKLPTGGKWSRLDLSVGPFVKEEDEEWTVGAGAPSWSQIDYLAIDLYRPGLGATTAQYDDLHIQGIVTRGAYSSTSIAASRCTQKLVTDSLAKTTNLVASNDSGTVAQLAKAELLRAKTSPILGSATVKYLDPRIMPGQITHALTRRINDYMRILEHKMHFGSDTTYSLLTLTSDLTNSNPREPTNQYNIIVKAANPDFQNRDLGNLKAREIDIDQAILAKDYP